MNVKEKEIEYVKNGKRVDGRKIDELRPIKIDVGVIDRADGSCYLEWGQNKIMAAVYGPREALPKHIQNPYRALVNYHYRMATFSVPDRKSPKPGRREMEISKVSGEALEKAIFLEKYPNTTIDVFVEILDSNAGTRVAGLAAASVALADAGIPMKDIVAAVGVGKIAGEVVLDLNKTEEDAPDAVDIPIAILPRTEEIVLLQMDGLLKLDEWKKALKMGIEGCKKVYELQKTALRKAYLEAEKEEKVKENAK
ncbi:MAG: exosome complex exonuclease Rrp41 [Candidatus Diapherotrites archaeon]|nr:exosome complex exonuclease Rrp41 [Candidatus Diapherotrites archaeon]